MVRFLKMAGLVVASIAVALLLLEVGVRLAGYRQLPPSGYHTLGWATRDADVGWRFNPGVWPVDCQLQPMTVQENGTRKVVGQEGPHAGPTFLLIGGSFAAGYGVDDAASLASRIQAEYPQATIINLATPGYGTYQSYLMVRKYLEEHPKLHVDAVVYGYASHHQIRNVADWRWIAALKSYSGGQLVPPVLEKDKAGNWLQRPPREYNFLSLAPYSDLVFFVQGTLLRRYFGIKDTAYQIEATCEALRLFDTYCKEHGLGFVAVNIFNGLDTNHEQVAAYCRERHIAFAEPALDVSEVDPAWLQCVSGGSGHPNARFHAEMGREVAAILKALPARRQSQDTPPADPR